MVSVIALGLAYWHRSSEGQLQRGTLSRWQRPCTATFEIYVPNDLSNCPKVLIVCRNPHTHPPPIPVMTPPALLEVFRSLLVSLDWKLADTTPRRIVLDSQFMHGLRRHLGWTSHQDPSLSDLHPSLGNLDHVRRHINVLRNEFFPMGTGLDGGSIVLSSVPIKLTSK